MTCFCFTVRGLLSCQQQLLLWGGVRQLYMHPSVTVNVSPSSSASRLSRALASQALGWWWVSQMELKCLVPQLSAMQIALSPDSITEKRQQWVFLDASFLFISVSLSKESPLLMLMSQPVISESFLFVCFYFLLQVYRHSYMASYTIYNIHTRYVFQGLLLSFEKAVGMVIIKVKTKVWAS